jgi:hypothetical protein
VDEIIYVTIAEVADPGTARVLVAALRGYGFHPMSRNAFSSFPGVEGLEGKGAPIEVPEAEAADARVLAMSLLSDMTGRKSAT